MIKVTTTDRVDFLVGTVILGNSQIASPQLHYYSTYNPAHVTRSASGVKEVTSNVIPNMITHNLCRARDYEYLLRGTLDCCTIRFTGQVIFRYIMAS